MRIVVFVALLSLQTLPTQNSYDKSVLSLINESRSKETVCGGQMYPPVQPLKPSPKLAKASRTHSRDMGTRKFFSHYHKRSTPKSRLKKVNYNWVAIGEIIAAGQRSPKEVVDAWLDSPSACKIIMSPIYREVGSGFVRVAGSPYTTYWSVELGNPPA
jgi:uncharacterized protein YkwD